MNSHKGSAKFFDFFNIGRDSKLNNACEATPYFTLNGQVFKCKVVKVVDGNTLEVAFFFNSELTRWKVQLVDVDAPRLNPRLDMENREEEIQLAKEAKEYLESLVIGKNRLFYIGCGDFDSFGRINGVLYYQKPSNDNYKVVRSANAMSETNTINQLMNQYLHKKD